MRKRRILITGASGLLGLNIALEAAKDHQVFGQVHSHPLNTNRFEALQTDLLAPGAIERLLDLTQPDWVIHCAALANVDACERDPKQAQKLNSDLPRQLAHHVARGGARLLHVSTDAVFDGADGGYREGDLPNPLSVYARTKLHGEQAVLDTDPLAIVARVNLFGWSISGKRSLAEFFFNKLMAGETCMGFTDVYFCPMHAGELGEIFLKMLDAGLAGVYHAVGSECVSKYEFGHRLANLFGFNECLIEPVSVNDSGLLAPRSPQLTLNIDKLSAALHTPLPNLRTGLPKLHEQFLSGFRNQIQQMVIS